MYVYISMYRHRLLTILPNMKQMEKPRVRLNRSPLLTQYPVKISSVHFCYSQYTVKENIWMPDWFMVKQDIQQIAVLPELHLVVLRSRWSPQSRKKCLKARKLYSVCVCGPKTIFFPHPPPTMIFFSSCDMPVFTSHPPFLPLFYLYFSFSLF